MRIEFSPKEKYLCGCISRFMLLILFLFSFYVCNSLFVDRMPSMGWKGFEFFLIIFLWLLNSTSAWLGIFYWYNKTMKYCDEGK